MAAGEYAIHILCDSDDIPNSPFIAQIGHRKKICADQIICTGPGIEAHGVVQGQETRFKVETNQDDLVELQINVSRVG